MSAVIKPLLPIFGLFIVMAVLFVIILIIENGFYKKSSYYKATGSPFLSVIFNKGAHGEYSSYNILKPCEDKGAKFLFNAYLPKRNGETTEIDLIMIYHSGIYVIESKNYSGWIFGSEDQRYWYQTLPAGRGRSNKEKFYNPVMQNAGHIKILKEVLEEDLPIRSLIAFSERCTLKDVNVKSEDVYVVKRDKLFDALISCNEKAKEAGIRIEDGDIERIYDKLYPYTQVDEATKQAHIEIIKSYKE